jgi:glycine cleavage system transcriptional repressor
VAAITGVLFDNDCNIRDSTMTILAGEFVMLLIVELPEEMSNSGLDQALSDVQRRFDLGIFVKELKEEEIRYTKAPGSKNWAVTIYGGDRKGMLHHVASLMARKGVAGIISMKVIAPENVELPAIRKQLQDMAVRFGVEVSIG